MKTTLPSQITTVNQATDFLTELYNNGESYHPEDDANDICWSLPPDQIPTSAECTQLNKLMQEDIYSLPDIVSSETMEFEPCEFLLSLDAQEIED